MYGLLGHQMLLEICQECFFRFLKPIEYPKHLQQVRQQLHQRLQLQLVHDPKTMETKLALESGALAVLAVLAVLAQEKTKRHFAERVDQLPVPLLQPQAQQDSG